MTTISPPPEPRQTASRDLSPRPQSAGGSAAALWRATALIAATFTLIVAAVVMTGYKRAIAEDPIATKKLAALKEQLHTQPANEPLKKQIREMDLAERQRYFASVHRNTTGGWLLVIGSALFVLSAARFHATRQQAPSPRAPATPAAIEREATFARGALITTCAVILSALAIAGITKPARIRPSQAAAASATTPAAAAAATELTVDVLHANWPRFRGFDGAGTCTYTNIPVTWNIETGQNILWKTVLPLPGHNSPVIWGNKLFLTGNGETERAIFCFDAGTGALLWRLPANLVAAEAVAAMDIPKLSGSTAATVACDDQHVFAMFGTGELIAADHDGHPAWSKNFGKLENPYGHATSLVAWRNRLLLQLDQGSEEAGKSRLYAFNAATGEIIWQQKRMLPSSWATPLVLTAGGVDQVVCIGQPSLITYNFADGKELWRYEGLGSDLTPSPIFAAGLVFGISPSQRLIAIRPDGHGDITKSHVAWMAEENVPDITSPTSNGELLFTMETSGNLVCREAATGRKLWEHAYDGEFQSSPAIAGSALYASTTEGDTYVVAAGKEFKELAHNKLGDPIRASPAFTSGRMYVRGATNLFCISAK